MHTTTAVKAYGLIAEFTNSADLLHAARRARDEGYRHMDAYSPLPVHGLMEAMGVRDNRVPWIVFLGGLTGAITGYLLQLWVSAVDYPLNAGGKPYHSWPAFIPVTFEMTVLFAALSGFVGMLALNGLPRPHHSVFNAPGFDRATTDRFFLCIESTDPKFDRDQTEAFLQGLDPVAVSEVAP